MLFKIRSRFQTEEAMGPVNRWFCSERFGYQVEDQDILMTYFIKSGGADDFRRRFTEAMGDDNRWYCSKFHGRMIDDPCILWPYYKRHSKKNKDDEEGKGAGVPIVPPLPTLEGQASPPVYLA